jgi:hypothetical protein
LLFCPGKFVKYHCQFHQLPTSSFICHRRSWKKIYDTRQWITRKLNWWAVLSSRASWFWSIRG